MQTIERTHSTRSRDQKPVEGGAKGADPPGVVKIDVSAANSLPSNRPLGRQLSRRVSFGSQRMIAAARPSLQYRLQQALEKCLGQLPCLPMPKPADAVAEPVDAVDVDEVKVDSSKLAKAQAEAPLKSKEADKASKLLSDTLFQKVKTLFAKIDSNSDGELTHEEAKEFWSKNFAKVNAKAMFNEVDNDANGSVTFTEWISFWENVISQPAYAENEEDVLEEIDSILKGGSWVDWDDGRNT